MSFMQSRDISKGGNYKMITKEKFDAYVEVQKSGLTNMFDIKNVQKCSDFMYNVPLSKEDCLEIMKNYKELKEKFNA